MTRLVSTRIKSYQVVVWFDAEQIPEVAESQWGVRLEAEVRVVMSWGQVASLTGMCSKYSSKSGNKHMK